MEGAEKCVYQGLEMFRANGGQPDQPHPVVVGLRGTEIGSAIHGHVVPHLGQALADLFVVGFDAAVFRNHAAATDKSDPQRRFRDRFGLGLTIFSDRGANCSYSPAFDVVALGRVLPADQARPAAPIFAESSGARPGTKSPRQLGDVTCPEQHAGFALMHQFPSRTQVRRHDCASMA